MNFTREPIIETIITPKEGHKLIVRNTKGSVSEEYIVDAVEVVSFGNSFFFRSLERPKSFLVPVSDYEIIETKEMRVALKNVTFEKTIKIGGGKEKTKEKTPEVEEQEPIAVEQRLEKKRERRRHRRRRGESKTQELKEETKPETELEKASKIEEEVKAVTPILSRLIPPPPTLIAEKFSKEKNTSIEPIKSSIEPEETSELEDEDKKNKKTRRRKEGESDASDIEEEQENDSSKEEGGNMQRIATEPVESTSSNTFSSILEKSTSFLEKFW